MFREDALERLLEGEQLPGLKTNIISQNCVCLKAINNLIWRDDLPILRGHPGNELDPLVVQVLVQSDTRFIRLLSEALLSQNSLDMPKKFEFPETSNYSGVMILK